MTQTFIKVPLHVADSLYRYLLTRPMAEVEQIVVGLRGCEQLNDEPKVSEDGKEELHGI